jgi:hypothetical protein
MSISTFENLSDAPFAFGLEAQGHIPTVETMLDGGSDWKSIGKAIGWDGDTAAQYYHRHLTRLAAMNCETIGVEDLEVGCCRTCRARDALAKAEGRS